MFNLKRSWALGTGLLCVALVMGSRAEAGGIAITTPAGLVPGDTFRIVFVTDGAISAANSTDISYYNTFVNTAAANAGGATYDGVALTWSAIASTASVSASSNIGSIDAPIYLSNGTLVSAASDLWSGSLTNPIDEDLAGNTVSGIAFTGSTSSGDSASSPLGTSYAEIGYVTSTTSTWISEGAPGANAGHIYAISQVLTVAAIPEPSPLIMGMTAIGAGLALSCFRRCSAQRRLRPAR